MARVNVYVDGLNLYNGALRGTPYRWIDLQKLSRALLKPGDEIQRIRYFTALLVGAANSTIRQQQKTHKRPLQNPRGPQMPGLRLNPSPGGEG